MVVTLPYYNATRDGYGMEGLISYTNSLVDYWMIPAFLLIFYGLSIYGMTKTEYKMGGIITYASAAFFLLAMIAQAFTQFHQAVIFFFLIMTLVGVVITRIEA